MAAKSLGERGPRLKVGEQVCSHRHAVGEEVGEQLDGLGMLHVGVICVRRCRGHVVWHDAYRRRGRLRGGVSGPLVDPGPDTVEVTVSAQHRTGVPDLTAADSPTAKTHDLVEAEWSPGFDVYGKHDGRGAVLTLAAPTSTRLLLAEVTGRRWRTSPKLVNRCIGESCGLVHQLRGCAAGERSEEANSASVRAAKDQVHAVLAPGGETPGQELFVELPCRGMRSGEGFLVQRPSHCHSNPVFRLTPIECSSQYGVERHVNLD